MHNVFMATRLPFLWFQDVTIIKTSTISLSSYFVPRGTQRDDDNEKSWFSTSVTHFHFENSDQVTCLIECPEMEEPWTLWVSHDIVRRLRRLSSVKRWNIIYLRFPLLHGCCDRENSARAANRQRMRFRIW